MKNISFKIDGLMLLIAIGSLLAGWLYYKRGAVKEIVTVKLNPANEGNLINQGAQNVVGKDRLQGFFDKVFAAGDILTPWNGVDTYAKQVWGLD